MRVRYTEPAAEELETIIAYFRNLAPSVVADFIASIDDAVSQLPDNPYLVWETEKSGVRRWYIRRFLYSMFFTIQDDELAILHIRYAARRQPWEPPDD